MRPIFYFCVAYGTHLGVESKFEKLEHSWLLGFVAMSLVYLSLRLFFEHVLGLTHLGAFDELYLYDSANNRSIISAILYFDKFDDKMLTHLKNRMLKY